jgi:hypothetical protein
MKTMLLHAFALFAVLLMAGAAFGHHGTHGKYAELERRVEPDHHQSRVIK